MWETRQVALADFEGAVGMNVAGNDAASSSLLRTLPLHDTVAPHARSVGTEVVAVVRLDEIGPGLMGGSRSTYLKVDVQGAEEQVIAGAAATLGLVSAVQLELSLFALYEGARLFNDVIATMERHGFRLAGLEPGLVGLDGRLLQVDGLFVQGSQEAPTSAG
jgi:FkbM family methyltransferase